MSLHINNNQFSYILDLTNKKNQNLIINQHKLKFINEKNSDINTQIQNLLLFLINHNELTSDRLKKIKTKFSSELPNNQELLGRFEDLNKKLSQQELPFSIIEPAKIEVQVTPPPQTIEEWLFNLALVADKFPKYQLGNDLAVYDTAFLPSDEFDAQFIRTKLKEKKEELAKEKKTELIEKLINSIDFTLNLLKPHKIIHLSIVIEEKLENNRALFFDCESAIEEGKHLCITKKLIQSHPSEFDALFKNSDLYIQAKGTLMLVFPKGTLPQDHGYILESSEGYKEDFLSRWPAKPSEIEVTSNHEQNVPHDLKNLLANDISEQGYARFIYLTGHWEEGVIAGIQESIFPDLLQVLADKKTLFVGISSCYLGNENYCTKLTTPTNKVPFPILFLGISHISTFSKFPMLKILEEIQQDILGNKATNMTKKPLWIKPLLRKNVRKILTNFYSKDPIDILSDRDINDLPSLMLPTDKNIPRTTSSITFRKNIIDLSADIPQESTSKVLQWSNTSSGDDALYVFSKPILNIALTTFPHPTFISRGTNSYHLLDSLICKSSNLLVLTENTLTATEGANVYKTFAIREFKGQNESQENVVIHYSISNSFVIFKKPGEMHYYKWIFQQNNQTDEWNFSSETKLSSLEAEEEIFSALNKSQPSKTLREITTAGQFTDQQFFDTFCHSFWKSVPPSVKLFVSLASKEIHEHKVFSKEHPHQIFTQFELALAEISQITDKEIKLGILSKAFSLAKKVGYGLAEIIKASQNPLMNAIEDDNYSQIQTLIKNHPEWIHERDCQGKTILNMLLENEGKSIMLTFFYHPSIWQGEAGYWALNYAILHADEASNEKVRQELIKQKAGTNFQKLVNQSTLSKGI